VSIGSSNADSIWIPECTVLAALLHEIYGENKSGKKSERLEYYFQQLERSAGLRPAINSTQ
jgi:hypothetical protein